MKVYLPQGDHVFRAQFMDDKFANDFTQKTPTIARKTSTSIRSPSLDPTKSNIVPPSRKKILICDPKGGRLRESHCRGAGDRAYRRPVTPAEVASLVKFVNMAKQQGPIRRQGLQLAIQAMLVSPHFLFRIEHDAGPVHILFRK